MSTRDVVVILVFCVVGCHAGVIVKRSPQAPINARNIVESFTNNLAQNLAQTAQGILSNVNGGNMNPLGFLGFANFGTNFAQYPGQNQGNFGQKPGGNFGSNQGNVGLNPGGNFGQNQGNFEQRPGANFGQNSGGNFGQRPGGNFGQNPGGNFGQNSGGNFGQNPAQFPGNFGTLLTNFNSLLNELTTVGPVNGGNQGRPPFNNGNLGPGNSGNFGNQGSGNHGPEHHHPPGPPPHHHPPGPPPHHHPPGPPPHNHPPGPPPHHHPPGPPPDHQQPTPAQGEDNEDSEEEQFIFANAPEDPDKKLITGYLKDNFPIIPLNKNEIRK